MEHKGLEPEIDKFQRHNKQSNLTIINTPHHAYNKNVTNFKYFYKTENIGQISDKEKSIIDSFRAQYEHNESPSNLINLIKVWPNIPENVAQGILAMVSCYLK